ncbi:ABC transporter substrate-binding protein [Microvirga sp. VF16]|uniref:ABC transporter substrate-binding protein n=1 Tax=Microvirga sp. VF16 TaxID=2807101 RepID=UPI00193EB9C0|nr:extracellular solute-binding protein [Microvirga sp. VF16]QRM32659.1 extracellular solute-binding protein [Microvirga sp. VF16]
MKALLKAGLTVCFTVAGLFSTQAEIKDNPALVEASKAEKGVLVYSNLEPEYWEPVLELFASKYPWIKVATTNMGGDLWEKYYAESSTKTRTADLILTGSADRWLEFADKGEIVDYVSPHTPDLPAWSRPLPGLYTASTDPFIIAYNKFLIAKDKAPKSLADIARLAPGLKGKISTYDAAANPLGLSLFWEWNKANPGKWDEVIKPIGVSSRPERSAGTIRDKVLTGEYATGIFLSGVNIPRLSRPDAQKVVDWAFPADGTPLVLRGLALTKAASSPNSAKLLLDTLLSRAGQIALAKGGVTPYRADVKKEDVPFFSYSAIVDQIGAKNVIVVGYDRDLMANREAFTAKWKDAFSAK